MSRWSYDGVMTLCTSHLMAVAVVNESRMGKIGDTEMCLQKR